MAKYFGFVAIACCHIYLTNSDFVFNNYDPNELEIGSSCSFNRNKSEGICRQLRNCPGAYRDYYERHISPTICAYGSNAYDHIVCCGYKRRYEAYCDFHKGSPETERVCPSPLLLYECENDSGSKFYPYRNGLTHGVRAGSIPYMVAVGWRYSGGTQYKWKENELRKEELRIREKEADNKAKEIDMLRAKAEADERTKMVESIVRLMTSE